MNIHDERLLLKIKAVLFDLLGVLGEQSGSFANALAKLVHQLKEQLAVKDVTLYTYNDSSHYYVPEASTSSGFKMHADRLLLPVAVPSGQTVVEEEEAYLIFLKNDELSIGLIRLEKDSGRFPDDFLTELGHECSKFVLSLQKFTRFLNEEKRYEQLYRVTAKFHSSMSMSDVLGEIITTLQRVYPGFRYYLLLSQDNSEYDHLPVRDLQFDSEHGNLAAMQAYVTGKVQLEDSIENRRSVLYAPLKGKQGIYGVLEVTSPDTVVFPMQEVNFITLLANTAGSALENAKLYEQSRRLISDLQLINEASHKLNSNLRLTESMTFMSEQIRHSFGADEVGFILFLPENGVQMLPGSTPFFQTEEAQKFIALIEVKVKSEMDSLFIGDVTLDEDWRECWYRSLMGVPMVQSGVLKGVAVVLHRAPYHFSFDNFKLMQSLIHHSTLAFTNAMLREELEKLVITDNLTKLYSRSYLNEQMARSLKEDAYGTFLLIDIDNFKKVNDTFGHQIGDEILIQVSNIIKNNIREKDIGARWGGEELAVYLPRVPLQSGKAIADRLVKNVSEKTNPGITISCGVSFWTRDKKENSLSLFKKADEALYRAKNRGKNQFVVSDETGMLQ